MYFCFEETEYAETCHAQISRAMQGHECGREVFKQAQAGNSMRHLRDIRRGVTDGQTDADGRTDPLMEMR